MQTIEDKLKKISNCPSEIEQKLKTFEEDLLQKKIIME